MSEFDRRATNLLRENVHKNLSWNDGLKYQDGGFSATANKNGVLTVADLPDIGARAEVMLSQNPSLKFQGRLPAGAQYEANLREGGEYNLNMLVPAGGGNLGFDMSRDAKGDNRYMLQYRANW